MSKTVGMMQPYLFPYLGYFQLIAAVDVFVLGDELQYVKESWINRNRILMNGKDRLITFPLKKAELHAKINERVFCDDFGREIDRLLRVIHGAYAKAPQFNNVFPFIEEIIRNREDNLAKYAENSIRKICGYLNIRTPIVIASDLSIGAVDDKQDRVIKTIKKLNGTTYVNFIGGVDLYDFAYFESNGLRLRFHRINDITYPQLGASFVPLLSIIDVLMFNDVPEVQRMLHCFSLLDKGDFEASSMDAIEKRRGAVHEPG